MASSLFRTSGGKRTWLERELPLALEENAHLAAPERLDRRQYVGGIHPMASNGSDDRPH